MAGFRASYALAFHLAYGLRLFRTSVQLLDGHAGGLEMQLRALQPGDAILVVGFAPYSREAALMALTDSTASPLSLLADEMLLFSVHSPSFFPSTAAGLALVEALLELVVALSGSVLVERIPAAENQFFASGAYLQKPPARSP